jgi:hypothetical protein
MNKEEAAQLLEHELANLRSESYADLVRRIPERLLAFERSTVSGTTYQVEIQFLWDDRPGDDVRVMGSIDDGGLRAFLPLSRSFIKSADGSFVGE